jgi:hypothetical protein
VALARAGARSAACITRHCASNASSLATGDLTGRALAGFPVGDVIRAYAMAGVQSPPVISDVAEGWKIA